ncbi:MAG: nitroreductase family protein [Dysgonamonadaceae bacterium]|nr:nitroreductase family protein [Dysgonamonadaceae bacterium]
MKKIFLLIVVSCFGMSLFAQDIQLPAPQKKGGKPLMEAINQRQSVRTFSDKDLDLQTISNLMWVAYGYNREDKLVIPTAMDKQQFEIYVALKAGVYQYDAKANKLILKVKGDHRKATGKQDYVWNAPVNFIYVVNSEILDSSVECGAIFQNVYLYCSSAGLGSVVRGYFDQAELKKLLNLGEKKKVVLCQTVGYKAG